MRLSTRRTSAQRRTHELRPRAEGLEDRLLLASTLGGRWTYGERITYSFAPDWTDVGGFDSTWYQAMSSRGISEQAWKDEFRKAAAAWQGVTGINFVEVEDDGSKFSVAGDQQGDTQFGDIRIAGINLGGTTLAAAYLPPPFNGGTLAGDIVMNTQVAWNVNSTYDLYRVALHEFGHALGLGHSDAASTVMDASYDWMSSSLTSDDIAGIRSVYGNRPQDAFDSWARNEFYWNATNVTPYLDASKQIRLGYLDITTAADFDWYYVTAPAGSGYWLTVAAQSEYLSSLSPKVEVYNSALQLVATSSAPYSYGETVVSYVPAVVPGQGYYIRVMAANSGPSSNGSYAFLVNFGTAPLYLVPPPNTTVPEQPNQGGGPGSQLELIRQQLDAALGGLNLGMRKQVERTIAASTARASQGVDGLALPTSLRSILEQRNPAARRKLEEVLGTSEEVLQIGDLVGYGSTLTTAEFGWDGGFAGTEIHAGPRPGWLVARPLGSPAVGEAIGVFVVLTGEEVGTDVNGWIGRDRARAQAATRAFDHALETWERA